MAVELSNESGIDADETELIEQAQFLLEKLRQAKNNADFFESMNT